MNKIVLSLSIAISSVCAVNFSDTQLVRSQENVQAVIVNNSDALLSAAKEEYQKGNYDRAIDLSTQAIRVNANNINAFYYRGISRLALQNKQFQSKSLELIKNDLSRVMELNPSNRDAHYYYGLAIYKKMTLCYGSPFISTGNNIYRAKGNIQFCDFNERDLNIVYTNFKKYFDSKYNALDEAYLQYADIQILHGINNKDVNLILDRISDKNTNSNVYLLRGAAYSYKYLSFNSGTTISDTQEFREAHEGIENFSKSIKLSPNNPDAYVLRAGMYEKLNNFQNAIEDYTQVINLMPQEVTAYAGRARIYRSIGDNENALVDERYANDNNAVIEKRQTDILNKSD